MTRVGDTVHRVEDDGTITFWTITSILRDRYGYVVEMVAA